MGQDKALLKLAGVPLVERVVARLALVSDDLLLVSNEPAPFAFLGARVRVVPDVPKPGLGPLAAIAGALHAAACTQVLIVATDMPFLNPVLLRYLVQQAGDADLVLPVVSDHPQPLHALYHQRILPTVEELLARGERRVGALFPLLHVRVVGRAEILPIDPQLRSFCNANTPADWQRVQRLAQAVADA